MFNLIQKDDLELYLESSNIVDYTDPKIQEKAQELSLGLEEVQMVKNIYHFVRDEIDHSMDEGQEMVTFRASDVLKKGHGLCFAKSNLLAALLRFMNVPTGFCYQRLVHEDGFIFHGLNAVFLDGKWFRLDARGNREGVDAQFSMDKEKLAFYPQQEGEKDYPNIHSQQDKEVTEAITSSKNLKEAYRNLQQPFRLELL